MILFLRTLAVVVGVGAIGAVTYGTVEASGGLYSHTAPLYVALGALQIMLAAIFGILPGWQAKCAAAVVIFCCEIATFIGTANLQLADVTAQAAPVQSAAAKRQAAQDWLNELNKDDRVQRAEAAARQTRTDAMTASTAKGCDKNCKATLEIAVNNASAAVVDARKSLQLEKQEARKALNDAPVAGPENPLAEKLGMAASTVDLIFVGFRGFAVAVGAAILLAAGTHPRRAPKPAKEEKQAPAPAPRPVEAPAKMKRPDNVVQLRPTLDVLDFGADHLEPAPGATLDFDEFFEAYARRAAEQKMQAFSASEFVAPFKALCNEAGISLRQRGTKLFLCGVRLAS